jgi:hypothetical protein
MALAHRLSIHRIEATGHLFHLSIIVIISADGVCMQAQEGKAADEDVAFIDSVAHHSVNSNSGLREDCKHVQLDHRSWDITSHYCQQNLISY